MANDQVLLTGLESIQASDTTLTDDLTVTDALVVNGKVALGNAVTDSIGLYGVSKVSQPRGASQAALTTLTGAKTTTNVAAKLNALVLRWGKTRTDLVAIGAIKGAS